MRDAGESLSKLVRWLERGGIQSEAALLRALKAAPPASDSTKPGEWEASRGGGWVGAQE